MLRRVRARSVLMSMRGRTADPGPGGPLRSSRKGLLVGAAVVCGTTLGLTSGFANGSPTQRTEIVADDQEEALQAAGPDVAVGLPHIDVEMRTVFQADTWRVVYSSGAESPLGPEHGGACLSLVANDGGDSAGLCADPAEASSGHLTSYRIDGSTVVLGWTDSEPLVIVDDPSAIRGVTRTRVLLDGGEVR